MVCNSLFNGRETQIRTELVLKWIFPAFQVSYSDGASFLILTVTWIPVQRIRSDNMSKRLLLPQRMRILIVIVGSSKGSNVTLVKLLVVLLVGFDTGQQLIQQQLWDILTDPLDGTRYCPCSWEVLDKDEI